MDPSKVKDGANDDCERIEKKSPGYPVRSTKVPETTLTDFFVTYAQTMRHKTTDEDLKTTDCCC